MESSKPTGMGSSGPLWSDRAAELMGTVMAQRRHFRDVNLISDVLRCHRWCPLDEKWTNARKCNIIILDGGLGAVWLNKNVGPYKRRYYGSCVYIAPKHNLVKHQNVEPRIVKCLFSSCSLYLHFSINSFCIFWLNSKFPLWSEQRGLPAWCQSAEGHRNKFGRTFWLRHCAKERSLKKHCFFLLSIYSKAGIRYLV